MSNNRWDQSSRKSHRPRKDDPLRRGRHRFVGGDIGVRVTDEMQEAADSVFDTGSEGL